MYMFRYRRAKSCKACVVNHTNSCATNITIAQPRNAPPKPNRQKAIKTIENGEEVPTFVPNQNTVQDSYFFSGGFGNPNGSNRKLATLSKPNKTKASQIANGNIFTRGVAWSKGYITRSQSHLESNTGSMGRLERLKANAISGDRDICIPIKLKETNYLHIIKDNTTSGYVRPDICSSIPACGTANFGSINSCNTNITLLNFTLLAFESSNFPANYDINTNPFKIIWRRKLGLLLNTTPNFTTITISGIRNSNNQFASVTLNLNQTTVFGGGLKFDSQFPGENTITAEWDPAFVSDVIIVNDILNGPNGKRVVFTLN